MDLGGFLSRGFASISLASTTHLQKTGISELVNLIVEQIDLTRGYMKVMGKGSKERIVPVGDSALSNNTTANYNAAFGNYALQANTTGGSNTAIGATADVGSNNLDNTTAVGFGATVTARVNCGTHALGYVWFMDVMAFFQTQIFFRLW